jgi:predicted membrane protein
MNIRFIVVVFLRYLAMLLVTIAMCIGMGYLIGFELREAVIIGVVTSMLPVAIFFPLTFYVYPYR